MFARVKESRNDEYLQIVENYRDAGRVRQRLVMYVGHYDSIEDALHDLPNRRRRVRGQATKAERGAQHLIGGHASRERARRLREEADQTAEKYERLQQLVTEHPELLERDRERAERRRARQREKRAERRAQRSLGR